MPETRRLDDGSLVEIPPQTLGCGHPSNGNVESIGYAVTTANGERVRTYRCRTCGTVTFSPPA